MVKLLPHLLAFAILLSFSVARSITDSKPHALPSFKIKSNQTIAAKSCSYTVIIKTSCSSPSNTRDKISLDFGDASGNEVYAKRLDDPQQPRIFERCSTDSFQIRGPCTNTICYIYLLRVGSDGWKPESVQVYGSDRRALTFHYNTFLPNGVWYGFKHCK